MMSSGWSLNLTGLIERISHQILSCICTHKPLKTLCIFSFSFTVAFAVLILIVSVMYFNPSVDVKYECEESVNDSKEKSDVKPTVKQHMDKAPRIISNFLPEASSVEVCDEMDLKDDSELEALKTVEKALKMKNSEQNDKAEKLFKHAMSLQPDHPDILNHYGEFLEEKGNDVLQADLLYTKALGVTPLHSRAVTNQKRTLPVVNELDEKELERIDRKRVKLMQLDPNDSALNRAKKEIYFHHIHHTLAIEGNTMDYYETRAVLETRLAVSGRSITEHNEVIGLDAALRYINNTLVNKAGLITLVDILNIHKRVLGYVNPEQAGIFRTNQVFLNKYTPPVASDLVDLMEEFITWLQSDSIQQLHPVKLAALAHYKFVCIHPFVDGNGRTGRLLMNLILMRAGYPPVIIRKQDRSQYYNCIQLATAGDLRPFIRFIAHCTECTLDFYLYYSVPNYEVSCVKFLPTNSLLDLKNLII